MGCNDKPGGCGGARRRPSRSKGRKTAAAIAGAGPAPSPADAAAAKAEHVSVHRWCRLGWWGVPDPIRRHVARSLGLRSVPPMPGCGCLVRVTEQVDEWEEGGAVARQMARGVAWLAPLASAALGRGLTVYLAIAPPGRVLRRLLAETQRQAFAKVAPTQVFRIEGTLPRGFSMHGLAAAARKKGAPVGDMFAEAMKAAQAESVRKAGASGGD